MNKTRNKIFRIVSLSGTRQDIIHAGGLIPFTLDHIYTKGLDVMACGKVEHAEASDHLPLWTTLRFKETTTQLAEMEVGL